MKYITWLETWLEIYIKPNTKIRTYSLYKKRIDLHILPILGNLNIDELDALTLQKFVVSLANKGLSANTINSIISLLKSSLKRAVLLGKVKQEYTDAIIRPKQREKQVDCFTREEQKKIESYILSRNNPKLFGIVLCLYTGLRLGELLALKWEDINFNTGLLFVSKSCHDSWQNGKYIKVFDTPKTECSQRLVPLPKQLICKLKEIKKTSKSQYVVSNDREFGAEVRSYQKTFQLVLRKLNIDRKGFHSLRHTFATRALEFGIDVKTLSEILGHKNPVVTLKRYAHSMLDYKFEIMNKIGKLLNQ